MGALKGARYRVISDSENFFHPGEVVVALESSVVPYCVREEKYKPECKGYLCLNDFNPLMIKELEMLGYQPYLLED